MKVALNILFIALISTSAFGQEFGLRVTPFQLTNAPRPQQDSFSSGLDISAGNEIIGDLSRLTPAQKLCRAILPFIETSTFTSEAAVTSLRMADNILISPNKVEEIRQWIESQRVGQRIRPGSAIGPDLECENRARGWLPAGVQEALNLSVTTATPEVNTRSPLRTSCDGISEAELEEFCKTETANIQDTSSLQDINQVLQSTFFSGAGQSPRCNCLRDKVKERFPIPEDRQREIRNATTRLNNYIIQYAGRRFMDEFASSEEDLNFMSQLPTGDDGFDSASCIKPQGFSSILGSNCNVSQEDKQRRLNMIFNSFGRYTDAHNIEGLLQDFSVQLENVNIPGRTTPVSRDQFDVRRISLANTDPQVRMIQSMLSGMFSRSSVRERLNQIFRSDPSANPTDAVLRILREDFERASTSPDYIDLNILSDEYKNELTQIISRKDASAFSGKIHQHLMYSTVLHPGLGRMMKSRDVSDEIISSYSSENNNNSLFDRIAKSETLQNQFNTNCTQYKNQLKELVCTSPAELLKRVPAPELQNILNENSPSDELIELHSMLLCDNPRSEPLPSLRGIFSHIYNPDIHSDFREHVNPSGLQTPFKRLMLAEQEIEEVQNEVGEAVITFEVDNRGWADNVGGNRFHGDRGGRISDELIAETKRGNFSSSLVERVQKSQISGVQSVPVTAENQTQEETNLNSNETSSNASNQNVSSLSGSVNPVAYNNVTPSYITPASTSSLSGKTTNRSATNENNPFDFDPSEVERLRSNLSSGQLAELEELRKQAERDREKLQELTGKIQQERIRNLQEQLRQLENTKAGTVSRNNREAPPVENQTFQSSNVSQSFNSQPIERESFANSGSVNGGRASGSSSGVESASPGNTAFPRLPASVPTPSRIFSTPSEAFVITSSTTRDEEVAPQELSLEIIMYLSSNNPDLAVLNQIKENGMLYKFNLVENGKVTEKSVFINYDKLTPEARRIVETQISQKIAESPNLAELETQMKDVRRTYSYEALKYIVGQDILRQR